MIESGTFRGATVWLLKRALPAAEVWTFSHARRIIEAHKRGLKLLVVDDNFAATQAYVSEWPA